jgi:hypothetical protein
MQSLAHLAPPDGAKLDAGGWDLRVDRSASGERDGDQDQSQVTGYGPQPANKQALVIVTVEFDGPSEAMTFTVLVSNDGDEGVVREQAIARAQDLARRFADLRRSSPPPPMMPSG